MRKGLALFIALITIPTIVSAQYWNRYRSHKEWIFSLGAANFLGELGGANQIGTHFLKDFEFSTTRPAMSVGYRDMINKYMAYKNVLSFAMVNGSDKLTQEPFRHNRNLNFRSPIIEVASEFEGYFLSKQHPGHIYHIRHARGWKSLNLNGYLFAGVGVFFFNPQGQYTNGKWYNLKPLHTEGEGLPGGPKNYSRFNICFPVGIGFKTAIDRQWSAGFEYGIRYTTTDYIDDVSGVYYDKSIIENHYGPIAAYFADPSLGLIHYPDGITVTGPGEPRGDSKHRDAYMFATFNVSYKILYRRRTRSKF